MWVLRFPQPPATPPQALGGPQDHLGIAHRFRGLDSIQCILQDCERAMHPIRGCNIRIMSVYPTQSSCVHWAQVPSCVCTTILTCKYWNHSHLCSFTMCFIHNSKAYAYVCMTDCFGQPYCTSTTIFLKVEYQHVCSQKFQHVMSKVSNIWACEIPISDEMKIWYPTWQNSNIWCNRIPISNDTQVFPDQQETDLSVDRKSVV